jgi:hypothetical protein
MSKVLMNPERYSTAQINEVIARKLRKFGTLDAMPADTRALVEQGMKEIGDREQSGR